MGKERVERLGEERKTIGSVGCAEESRRRRREVEEMRGVEEGEERRKEKRGETNEGKEIW